MSHDSQQQQQQEEHDPSMLENLQRGFALDCLAQQQLPQHAMHMYPEHYTSHFNGTAAEGNGQQQLFPRSVVGSAERGRDGFGGGMPQQLHQQMMGGGQPNTHMVDGFTNIMGIMQQKGPQRDGDGAIDSAGAAAAGSGGDGGGDDGGGNAGGSSVPMMHTLDWSGIPLATSSSSSSSLAGNGSTVPTADLNLHSQLTGSQQQHLQHHLLPMYRHPYGHTNGQPQYSGHDHQPYLQQQEQHHQQQQQQQQQQHHHHHPHYYHPQDGTAGEAARSLSSSMTSNPNVYAPDYPAAVPLPPDMQLQMAVPRQLLGRNVFQRAGVSGDMMYSNMGGGGGGDGGGGGGGGGGSNIDTGGSEYSSPNRSTSSSPAPALSVPLEAMSQLPSLPNVGPHWGIPGGGYHRGTYLAGDSLYGNCLLPPSQDGLLHSGLGRGEAAAAGGGLGRGAAAKGGVGGRGELPLKPLPLSSAVSSTHKKRQLDGSWSHDKRYNDDDDDDGDDDDEVAVAGDGRMVDVRVRTTNTSSASNTSNTSTFTHPHRVPAGLGSGGGGGGGVQGTNYQRESMDSSISNSGSFGSTSSATDELYETGDSEHSGGAIGVSSSSSSSSGGGGGGGGGGNAFAMYPGDDGDVRPVGRLRLGVGAAGGGSAAAVKRACDLCAKRKRRCDGDGVTPCSLCRQKRVTCEFTRHQQRGKAPGGRGGDGDDGGGDLRLSRVSGGSFRSSHDDYYGPGPPYYGQGYAGAGLALGLGRRGGGWPANYVPDPALFDPARMTQQLLQTQQLVAAAGLKRPRLRPSPATGLLGMQESQFLDTYFTECGGYLPLTSECDIRSSVVGLLVSMRHAAEDNPYAHAENPEPDPIHVAILWSTIALGAGIQGAPLETLSRYSAVARDALAHCTDVKDKRVLNVHVLFAFLNEFMGNHDTFVCDIHACKQHITALADQGVDVVDLLNIVRFCEMNFLMGGDEGYQAFVDFFSDETNLPELPEQGSLRSDNLFEVTTDLTTHYQAAFFAQLTGRDTQALDKVVTELSSLVEQVNDTINVRKQTGSVVAIESVAFLGYVKLMSGKMEEGFDIFEGVCKCVESNPGVLRFSQWRHVMHVIAFMLHAGGRIAAYERFRHAHNSIEDFSGLPPSGECNAETFCSGTFCRNFIAHFLRGPVQPSAGS